MEITEEKDKRVKVRFTMDSGPAGRIMFEGMFPCVKLERKNRTNEVFGSEW